jgi:hypothetical protein
MFAKNCGRASFLAASLIVSLTASMLVNGMLANALDPNMTVLAPNFFASASPDNLTLTLTTNKGNYQNGQTIHISGTVESSDGTPLENGVVTILFSRGEWSRRLSVGIDNGAYAENYIISFGDPEGTWAISASAVDDNGNVGENSDNIVVSLPSNVYYTVDILSPPKNIVRSRGSVVILSLQVKEAGVLVENANVIYRSSTNDNISLAEGAPGTYSATYTIKFDDPTGNWCISAEATKMVGNNLKAGGSYTIVDVQLAVLQLDLLSPSGLELKAGEHAEIKVRASYPDGAPVEGATVTLSALGYENVVLAGEDNGVYKSSAISFENAGGWLISLAVVDASGNAGYKSYVFNIIPPALPSMVIYFLALIGICFAIGISAAVLTRKKIRLDKLGAIRAEKKQIAMLQTEAAKKYFKEGSITRNTYDYLMQKHARRMAELDKEERKRIEKASKKEEKKGTI